MKLAVLVMCGGQGKRLWPLSSAAQPKQFLAYPQQYSLFVQTLQRNYLDGFAQIDYIIVTSKEYEQQVRAELEIFLAWLEDTQATKLAPKINFFLVLEEVGCNTFPALQAGLFTYLNTVKQPADYLLVTPSDHYIAGDYAADLQQALAKCSTSREVLPLNSVQVQESAQAAAKVAASGSSDSALLAQLVPNQPCICSLGVTPSEPSTELGYIWNRSGEVVFLEKPDLVQAQALLAQNQAAGGQLVLWNTGIWVGALDKVAQLVEGFGRREVFAGLVGELERKLVDKLEDKLEEKVQLGPNAPSASLYRVVFPTQRAAQLPVESLDKALMEKIRLSCHPANFTWSDLGSWTAVTRLAQEVPEATFEQAPAAKLDDAASRPSNVQQASAVLVNQQHLKQQEHNLLAGRVHAHQVTNSFIRSYQKPIIAIGVDNLAIIENEDYIVVTALDRIDEARVLAEQAAASEQDREAALKQSTTSQAQNKN